MSIIKTIMTIMSLLVGLHTGVNLSDAEILNMEQQILEQYEQAGVTAYEVEDRLNMVNYEQLIDAVNSSGEVASSITMFGISQTGNLIKYTLDFETDGGLKVQTHSVTWRGSDIDPDTALGRYDDSYVPINWSFTENGYLFIQREFAPGWDGPSEQVGIKVIPINSINRENNSKYVAPLGYHYCNLLKTSWGPEDYSNFDIMKAYEKLFMLENNGYTPDYYYSDSPSAITGDVHGEQEPVKIPDEDFVNLLQRYFLIDETVLQAITGYSELGGYYYTPLSFDDAEGAYYSVSEVVETIENSDGTITLVINEVDKQTANDHVTTCRLTVMPEGEGWKYISCVMD